MLSRAGHSLGMQVAIEMGCNSALGRVSLTTAPSRWASRNQTMGIVDLAKATLVCGGMSLLVYVFPVLGQVLLIGIFGLLWLLYARATVVSLRRR